MPKLKEYISSNINSPFLVSALLIAGSLIITAAILSFTVLLTTIIPWLLEVLIAAAFPYFLALFISLLPLFVITSFMLSKGTLSIAKKIAALVHWEDQPLVSIRLRYPGPGDEFELPLAPRGIDHSLTYQQRRAICLKRNNFYTTFSIPYAALSTSLVLLVMGLGLPYSTLPALITLFAWAGQTFAVAAGVTLGIFITVLIELFLLTPVQIFWGIMALPNIADLKANPFRILLPLGMFAGLGFGAYCATWVFPLLLHGLQSLLLGHSMMAMFITIAISCELVLIISACGFFTATSITHLFNHVNFQPFINSCNTLIQTLKRWINPPRPDNKKPSANKQQAVQQVIHNYHRNKSPLRKLLGLFSSTLGSHADIRKIQVFINTHSIDQQENKQELILLLRARVQHTQNTYYFYTKKPNCPINQAYLAIAKIIAEQPNDSPLSSQAWDNLFETKKTSSSHAQNALVTGKNQVFPLESILIQKLEQKFKAFPPESKRLVALANALMPADKYWWQTVCGLLSSFGLFSGSLNLVWGYYQESISVARLIDPANTQENIFYFNPIRQGDRIFFISVLLDLGENRGAKVVTFSQQNMHEILRAARIQDASFPSLKELLALFERQVQPALLVEEKEEEEENKEESKNKNKDKKEKQNSEQDIINALFKHFSTETIPLTLSFKEKIYPLFLQPLLATYCDKESDVAFEQVNNYAVHHGLLAGSILHDLSLFKLLNPLCLLEFLLRLVSNIIITLFSLFSPLIDYIIDKYSRLALVQRFSVTTRRLLEIVHILLVLPVFFLLKYIIKPLSKIIIYLLTAITTASVFLLRTLSSPLESVLSPCLLLYQEQPYIFFALLLISTASIGFLMTGFGLANTLPGIMGVSHAIFGLANIISMGVGFSPLAPIIAFMLTAILFYETMAILDALIIPGIKTFLGALKNSLYYFSEIRFEEEINGPKPLLASQIIPEFKSRYPAASLSIPTKKIDEYICLDSPMLG